MSTETIRTIARNVYRLRQDMGWTQMELARRIGVQPARINELERCIRPGVNSTTLDKLAAALGVPVADLVTPHGQSSG
ncbi:MAG TPA: helix-turn-helix transcriptional regulator [Planctomycetota bacterium]|nr:helix-turn-helix transcriptional regulator [Planctomycetota bacterium]